MVLYYFIAFINTSTAAAIRRLSDLAAIGDHHRLGGLATLAADTLDRLHHVQALRTTSRVRLYCRP